MAQDAGVKDLGQLRQFGRNLNIASGNLTQLFQQLTQQMHIVCDSWQDDQNKKFMNDFELQKNEIERIAQQMQQFSQYINRSCDVLEQYKNLRV
jgi:uncharacterized protein YycO